MTTNNSQGMDLLSELLDDPEAFDSRGKAYELLQEYFKGKPLGTLRPLLKHENVCVRRSAAFIVAELGTAGSGLVLDVVPLISDSDLHIQWYALESVMVASDCGYLDQFIHVVRKLETSNSSLCYLLMRLVSNASRAQIEASIRCVDKLKRNKIAHKRGLTTLLKWHTVSNDQVIEMLSDPNELINRYGAIVAKRCMERSPELIQHAADSENEVVSQFARESVE